MRRSIAGVLFAAAATAAAAFSITPKPGSALLLKDAGTIDWKAPTHLPTGAEYHLLREDPATHGIQALARFPSRYAIAEHTHSIDETLVVLKGKLWVKAAGVEKVLSAGDYAVIPAGVPHEMASKTWFRKVWLLTATNAPYDLTYTQK